MYVDMSVEVALAVVTFFACIAVHN